MECRKIVFLGACFFLAAACQLFGQPEMQAWGNITGLRIEGQLMPFESSIQVKGNGWNNMLSTGKEQQNPQFKRDQNHQIVTTQLAGIRITETVTDLGSGKCRVQIQYRFDRDTITQGLFFCVGLPKSVYGTGTIKKDQEPAKAIALFENSEPLKTLVKTIRIISPSQQLKITGASLEPFYILAGHDGDDIAQVCFLLQSGNVAAGTTGVKTFELQSSGIVDRKDVHLILDAKETGRDFAGLGGNFRIQNLKTDPQVIDYCLKNLRVAWGRVEMPWRFWQPDQQTDPLSEARAGRLDPHVQRAMEMAKKLQQLNIPVILTDWSAPDWAIIGKPVFQHRHGEPWGNPLNPDSIQSAYKSIADYIVYLRDQYAVDIKFFSFNESDLGIYVRQTGVEHAQLIKGLGQYFISRGLKTKLLLGDNSDATTYSFIDPALKDLSCHPYIGAVSFHSWRGWETEILNHWTNASREINLPLIVGEGSIDAAAWAYPSIFLEETYAMQEISLYIRLMAICQPLSILQWQLTSDYSPLTGAGIFGTEGPLKPTQRFWNLKQLASTPEGLSYIKIQCDRPGVTCAAMGNSSSGKYVLHLVNNGASRKVIVSGVPDGVRRFDISVTSKTSFMQSAAPVNVQHHQAVVILPAGCFVTMISQ